MEGEGGDELRWPRLVTAHDVRQAAARGQAVMEISNKTIVTPEAVDVASGLNIELAVGSSTGSCCSCSRHQEVARGDDGGHVAVPQPASAGPDLVGDIVQRVLRRLPSGDHDVARIRDLVERELTGTHVLRTCSSPHL